MGGTAGGVFDPALEEALRERLHQAPDPAPDGPPSTCWTVKRIQTCQPWLAEYSPSGAWRLLHRYRLCWRRARCHLFSPDPAYQDKEDTLLRLLAQVAADPDQRVVVFLDEFTVYHWPLVGRTWRWKGEPAPVAERAKPGERRHRLVSALEVWHGRVITHDDRAIGVRVFADFLEQIAQAFPRARHIDVVLDNWPVHHAPEVRERGAALHRIHLVYLPTYSPWLNPIEKLWDWLKEAVLRIHRLAGHWSDLKDAVLAFLARFAQGSQDLLRRVGLLGDGKLARALHPTTDLPCQK